ncbi:MAG: tRNA lysidine(34) synthetase TilS [Actinomycetota bacterium]
MAEHDEHPLLVSLLSRCTFPAPTTPVTLAVSGGADSMALMFLAYAHGLEVTIHHVNHQLRPQSHRDVDVIAPVAEKLGIELLVHVVNIDPGPNLEARARDARYGVLPADVMTGHTADDQAETVLINLLRGAGTRGLSAMRPGHRRPLLALRRAETRALCVALDVEPVDDETNTDSKYLRNRVRGELVPLMNDLSQRDIVPLLVRTADMLRDEHDFLEELAASLDPTDARALAQAPLPLARRAVRAWLSHPYPPDVATVERVLAVARGDVLACDVGGGREVRRSKQRLHLATIG